MYLALAEALGSAILLTGDAGLASEAARTSVRAGCATCPPDRADVHINCDVAAAVRERHPNGVDANMDLVNYAPGAYDAALKASGRAPGRHPAGLNGGVTRFLGRCKPAGRWWLFSPSRSAI